MDDIQDLNEMDELDDEVVTADAPTPPGADTVVDQNAEAEKVRLHGMPDTRIAKILDLVGKPDSDLADISRLIAVEIASVIQLMSLGKVPGATRTQADLNNHVKALRELQKTLTEAEEESTKDVLNLDGPKFTFVFKVMMDLFEKALKNAGIEEGPKKQVMLQFRDLIKMEDERIRRDLNKL